MEKELNTLKKLLLKIIDKVDNQQKEILNLDDVEKLTSLKRSYIYKLNSEGKIPSYSYSDKGKLYFKRKEILKWMRQKKGFYKDDIDDSIFDLSL